MIPDGYYPDFDPGLDPEMSDSEDEHNGNRPVNGLDHDPEYVAWDVPPDLDPVDEPLLTDEEMRRLLLMRLGDLAEDEWLDMCRSFSLDLIEFTYPSLR
jgi:hypothetical protein